MYQTVGQDAIALVAQALDVPLYRRVIQGNPLEQAAEYGLKSAGGGGITGDETEDLYALLRDVLDHHPDIQAVSVGAILSNYQRVRVEHVCRRLSLTPLAYLWQRNQTFLLSEMISSGLNAILIKIAGAGLTPSDLARPLSSMQPKLVSLHQRFGTHPCGEGGEYETFTIDSPLFRCCIDIKATEIVVVDQNDIAPVAYLRIKHALLVKKKAIPAPSLDIFVPPLLEHPFETLRRHVEKSLCGATSDSASEGSSPHPYAPPELGPSVRRIGPWIAVGNVRPPASHPRPLSVVQELTRCFEILQNLLAENSPTHSGHSELLPASATITLLLPDLDGSTFSSANAAYASFFGASPPARACIGVGGVGVGLDCLAWVGDPGRTLYGKMTNGMRGETGTRKALHVQSLSYWAPANIGPYSQAISIPPHTFISGQIGLIPSSLTLPSPSTALSTSSSQSSTMSSTLPLETALVLQHTARIIRAAPNSGLGDGSDGGFNRSDSSSKPDMDDVSRDGNREGGWIQLAMYYLVHVADVDHVRKNVELIDGLIPTLYAVLSSLPRGARIEKQVFVHSGRFVTLDLEEGDESVVDKSPEFTQGKASTLALSMLLTHRHVLFDLSRNENKGDMTVQHSECPGAEIQVHYEISGFPPSSEACAVVFVRDSDLPGPRDVLVAQAVVQMKAIHDFTPFLERTLAAKAFVSHQWSTSGARMSNLCHVFIISANFFLVIPRNTVVVPFFEAMFGTEMPAWTFIPCRYVASRAGSEWDWAVTLMAV
ncbi:hypothetical protein JVT61DRAFT_12973 [Boletus reticuloceps]|uniref:Diphthine--ammonia ligase n=1 Tax=Boletus reticuloceps TaxID=495285 RepID=A0A8I2YUP0_9AGAM|nr:hypothetical protein JVT61DRAFT_12973 [Boletus reticuloceps]